MSDIKEFDVDSRDHFFKSMDYAKEFLKGHKKINIVGTTLNVNQATRVAETLKRDGFIEFDDIKTETRIINSTRQVRLVITVHITPDFDKLYKESEEQKKKREEERKKRDEEKRKKNEEKKKEGETKKPKQK